MKIVRTFRYLYNRFILRQNLPSPYYYESEKDEEEKSGLVKSFKVFTGSIYHETQITKEKVRVWEARRETRGREDIINWEIIQNSKSLLKRLFALCLLTSIIDYCCLFVISYLQSYGLIHAIPDVNFVGTFLEIIIGALSAILGIIVALYVVGIQFQQKYSPKVADYINQEPVINYFFELLVITDIFSMFLYLRTALYVSPPIFSLPFIEIPLIILSLIGILVMKSHYTYALKPRSLIDRISKELKEKVEVVSNRKSVLFESWTVITRARDRAGSLLEILNNLLQDLKAQDGSKDIAYIPLTMGYIMNLYVSKNHFIDTESGWWFTTKFNEVHYTNSTFTSLKLNYELRGLGPLRTTTSNLTWFSDAIRELLKETSDPANREAIVSTIYAYENILYGQHTKDQYGHYKKTSFGAIEHQEIKIFEDFFTDFCELFAKIDITSTNEYAAYLNTLFYIGTALINGFDYGKEAFEKLKKSLITDDQKLGIKREILLKADIPTIFKKTLIDYWERLEIEQIYEGVIITPKERLESEIDASVNEDEKKYYKKYFELLIAHHEKILGELRTKGETEKYYEVFKLKFAWISRLFFVKKPEYAEEYSDKLLAFDPATLPATTKEIIEKMELVEEVEKTIFPAVILQKRNLAKKLANILIFFLKKIIGDPQKPDQNELYTKLRLIVILGGFIYLVSEFEQSKDILIDYAEVLENNFSREQLVILLKLLEDPTAFGGKNLALSLINREVTRYHNWFGEIAQKISALPRTYANVRFYSGLQEVADHPSGFIQQVSHGFFPYEEDCIKQFVEFMIGRIKEKLANAPTN